MSKGLRQSGIYVIGEVPWGTRVCQIYETEAELLELVVPYIAAGLESNEHCALGAAEPLLAAATTALRRAVQGFDRHVQEGRLELLSSPEALAAEAGDGWKERADRAASGGFDGARVSLILSGQARRCGCAARVPEGAVPAGRALSLCAHPAAGPAEVLDAAAGHDLAAVRRGGAWERVESRARARADAEAGEKESRVRLKLESILSPEGDLQSLELADIVDARELQSLMDDFHKVAPMPMFLIDVKGRILGGVGWSDICTRFHRVHPESCQKCVESDTEYSAGIPAGEYRIYRCKNGMWSAATPIILGGRHLGNLFSGQFFFTDEEPDRDFFRIQARRYGFPEEQYLSALDRAPRLSRAFVAGAMRFYLKLAQNIAEASWSNICLARSVAERDRTGEELRRVNRMLAARGRIDQAMLRATDEQGYLDEVCRVVVETCGHAMVWIGWAEAGEGRPVRPAACAGRGKSALESIDVACAVEAMRTRKPVVCRDVPDETRFGCCRESARDLGYASSAVLPLLADGRAIGAIAVYSVKPDAFSAEELRLLFGLAEDLAYGVGALRMRAARKQAEARFQQAQKMEAVGLMAGGIAHDFNNILASIVGYNSLLLDELKGSRLRRFSLEIQRSSELAATLTQQLLGVSGNRGAQRRVLDPNSVIMAMAKMLRRLVGEKIRLELKLHRPAWPLKMDSGQLEQIILNLAVNARDAMPNGGTLTLATRNLISKKERHLVIEVRDDGVGISAEVQARMFEPFFTTKGPGRGTGLGLSTVKSIAEEYHGRVTVDSTPGRGSVFRVILPGVKGRARAMAPGGDIKKSHRGRETILVVEDNASLLAIIKMTLRRAGYSVVCARTAEEAVSLGAKTKKHIDLLLADVVLPDMDGPQVAARLKETRPGLRTVYMSGYPGNALAPITGFGRCVLLEKPFSPPRMLHALREVLDRGQGDLF